MPGEQGCLIRLLNSERHGAAKDDRQHPHRGGGGGAGLPSDVAARVRVVPMLPFNSPWGSVVRHLWGSHWYLRGPPHRHPAAGADILSDELRVQGE